MDECRKRLRKVGRKGVEGSSSDFYFASLDGNLVLDAGERQFVGDNVGLTNPSMFPPLLRVVVLCWWQACALCTYCAQIAVFRRVTYSR